MTNFDLHERAQQLADTASAYELARRLIEMEQERDQLRGCFHNACEELTAMKAALVEEGDAVPTGPALSLVEELKADRDALQRLANCRAEQRDSLAAYAEELRKAGNRAICYGGAESPDQWHEAIERTPAASLTHRDARVAAQTAVQIQWNVFGNCVGYEKLQPHVVLGWLSDYAEEYSRQAEEASDGN